MQKKGKRKFYLYLLHYALNFFSIFFFAFLSFFQFNKKKLYKIAKKEKKYLMKFLKNNIFFDPLHRCQACTALHALLCMHCFACTALHALQSSSGGQSPYGEEFFCLKGKSILKIKFFKNF
jgi:hypothetical protein